MLVYVLLAILGLSFIWVNREGMESGSSSALSTSQTTAGGIKVVHDQMTTLAALQEQVDGLSKRIHDTSTNTGTYAHEKAKYEKHKSVKSRAYTRE